MNRLKKAAKIKPSLSMVAHRTSVDNALGKCTNLHRRINWKSQFFTRNGLDCGLQGFDLNKYVTRDWSGWFSAESHHGRFTL